MKRNDFWCITTYFNPAHYKSRIKNHNIFVKRLADVNLLVIELAFGEDAFEITSDFQLRAKSVLWPKERMLNFALSKLPEECKYVAWVDGDVIFEDDWQSLAIEQFEKGYDVLQLFENVHHLPPDSENIKDTPILTEKGLVWQSKTYPDFINLRKSNKLLYATTGFAWAARKSILRHGFYDKHVLGANDNVMIDACLNTFELHHYYRTGKGTELLNDMLSWCEKFGFGRKVNYLPITVHHLFHGHKKNRGYLSREDILKKHNFSLSDIKLSDHMYEWATNKPEFHKEVKNYFSTRMEDSV